VLVERDGDAAQLRAVVDGSFADATGTRFYEIGEVYRAGARRVSGEWRLTEFVMTPIWQSGTRPTT
jgi:hypothetical protein